MESGYYWIVFPSEGEQGEETIGYYHSDTNISPWIVVGSDESFENHEVRVIRKAI